ncbi:MAG: 3-deoxy-7-phosphoheptulonate synthase class II [Deltaproteobacteria bacterium HGW-Deltaproteobacteria-14]|nr:MAG: 3-deoxy-7-phosphoheptulonate synthase class II [Deltaproteobacteria bacterium HGW-Deltaproteobacteria-14]
MSGWRPDSWREHPIQQQPRYRDPEAVRRALARVAALPPLVAHGEVDTLRAHLARAAQGEAFVLHGGDCAERFLDCARGPIESKLKILLQMSLVLTWGARLPIIRVARMAGQYAKPRSSDTEVIDGVELPSYRGDHVNDSAPTPEAREPDPERLVSAYFHSAATLNYARALLDGGFADLHKPHHWQLAFVRKASSRAEYEAVVARLLDAVEFVESTGVETHAFDTVELFSSHEGLLLPWEQAHTARVGAGWYNLGAHMLWIGDRTRAIDGAHVEYFRGIENPIGVKIGPSTEAAELVRLLAVLEPADRPGRITLITRLGAGRVGALLPPLIEAVRASGRTVVWSCDPMHGNSIKTAGGVKTREVARILDELRETFDVHDRLGSVLGGVHFELTGEDVTECTGGPQELSEADLQHAYETLCDPRLNYAQSLEMAFLLAQRLARRRG